MLFISLIPHAQIEHSSRKETAFRNTQKEAGDEQSGKILREAHEGAHNPPYEGKGGKPKPRRRAFENDVTGDLEQDIADKPDSQCREVLISGLFPVVRVVQIADIGKKGTYSYVCLRLNLRCEHFQLQVDELKGGQEKGMMYYCFDPGRKDRRETSKQG